MKNLITLLCFIIVSAGAFGQTKCGDSSQGWNLEMGNTFLEIVFTDSSNRDSLTLAGELFNSFRILSGLKQIQVVQGSMVMTLENRRIDFVKQGYTRWSVPDWILFKRFSFNVSIDIKDGRYRMVFSNILSRDSDEISNFDWAYDIYNGDGCVPEFRKNSVLESLKMIRQDFLATFQISKESKKTDW